MQPDQSHTAINHEQHVLNVMAAPWQNKDGHRNMGNLAEKAGITLGELNRTLAKLEREGRYFPPRG